MAKTENEKRIERERRIVRQVVRKLKLKGWEPVEVDFGGDKPEKVRTEAEVLEHVFSVNESRVVFKKTVDGKVRKHSVLLICGNDCDIVTDYTIPDGLDEEIERAHKAIQDYSDSQDPRG